MKDRIISFEALGLEKLGWDNPRLFVPFATLFISGAGLTVGFYALYLLFGLSPYLGLFALIMILAFVASISTIGFIRLVYYKIGIIKFDSNNDSTSNEVIGSGSKLSYVSPRNRQRQGLFVTKVEPRPNIPLTRPRGEWRVKVPGTNSSMAVHFKNLVVELGFQNSGEMINVLKILYPDAEMYRCQECGKLIWKAGDLQKHERISGHVLTSRVF